MVPSNSVVRVACKLDDHLGDYYLESGDLIHQKKVLMPYIVRSAGDSPIICLVNPTNNFKTLKKNEIIANAHEIDTILGDMQSANTRMASSQSSESNCAAASSPSELRHGTRSVAASSPTNLCHRSRSVAASSPTEVSRGSKPVAASSPTGKPKGHRPVNLVASSRKGERNIAVELPSHLHGVFEASRTHLNAEQESKVAGVLRSYADVFAESEFDLGKFTAIKHAIDTGHAKPIKQRMRRTPACFVDEEEAHLKKMLDAGVIQESV